MDVVTLWARRIAEQVVPGEVAGAEAVGAAYAAGGKRRRELFAGGGAGEPGGFGGGLGPGDLAVILDALRFASDHLLELVAENPLANLMVLLAMRQGMRRRAGTTAQAVREEGFERVVGGLEERLRAQGVAADRAEELTYQTLKVVFQQDRDTEEIRAFLRALSASPAAEPVSADRLLARQGEGPGWMLPPWLWLYFLGVSAPGVPMLLGGVQEDLDGISSLVGYLAAGAEQAAATLLTGAGLLELFPALLLLSGILGVAFPDARGRWAERRHRLRPSDDPTILAMTALVRRHAPGIDLRLGDHHDRVARVYPVGWRTARIAVYPPLLRMWHADREAATAVLLHEVAHLRQGDHLIVGLASPFAWLVRVWGVLLTALVLIPVVLYVTADGPEAQVVVLTLLHDTMSVPIALILPVAGLWVAELSADRFALQEAGPAAFQRALGPAGRRGIRAVFTALTHPPRALRLRAATAWPGGTALSAAIWPVAVVARFALIALFQLVAHQLNGYSFGEALSMVGTAFRTELSAAQVVLIEILVLLVNWPLLAPLWMRIWTPVPAVRQRFAPYLVSALVPAVLAAGSLTAGVTTPPQPSPPGLTQPTESAEPTPERTGIVDDRPWAGRQLPVQLRITQARPLQQVGGPPEWLGPAVSWLGPGTWRAEADGRLTFENPAGRTDIRAGEGLWFRAGDVVTFWLAVELNDGGRPVATEISGEIDLATATMTALWMPKLTSSDPRGLLNLPSFQISTTVSVDQAV
ncbi:hypothetical protein Aph01nite_69440 [Acrocarpospora phusangensis]|uniref:Peptidase M48 domain-containing protein n=1 Tax=Acrocarpospora phusangensis TaxID=1070424 RepID=A0A919QGF0_9ACTN|nr:M48 family metalloprotease [Acrocarpospora phusangensis]GIH28634.1 hypothetical protein Aph01nite_69440 [Acrocarpospora phusangensis]